MEIPAPPRRPTDWFSIWQLGLSALTALMLFLFALLLLISGLASLFDPTISTVATTTNFLYVFAIGTLGALTLPSAWYALLRLTGRRVVAWGGWAALRGTIILLPFIILVGYGVTLRPRFLWWLLPLLNVLAVALPIFWLIAVGSRDLRTFSAQRAWGVFATALVFGPALIIVIEGIILIIGFVIVAVILSGEPGFLTELERLQRVLSEGPPPTLDSLMPFFEQYILRTDIFVLAMIGIAVIVPLVEELLKPIGMWLLARRKWTPATGFVAGMLSGGGFALAETILQGAAGEGWALQVSVRMGTSVIHILVSGLVGWGLALAFSERKWGRAFFHYAIAVVIHGVWNGMAVMAAVSTFSSPNLPNFSLPWEIISTVVLATMAGGGFIALILINRRLQSPVSEPLPAQPAPEPVPDSSPLSETEVEYSPDNETIA